MSNTVYGRIPSLNSILTENVSKAYLQENFSDTRILNEIKKRNIEISYVSKNDLNKLSQGGNHQGIFVIVEDFKYSTIEDIIKTAKDKSQPLVLILDGIEDPHNFGAIIRSADAFGVDGIIIKNRGQVPVNMTVSKTSTGAINYVKIAQVANLSNAIKILKDNGYWVYATDGNAKDNYCDLKYDGPTCLILGSEGDGISNLLVKNSDFLIKIPMVGHVNSLNVSVAAGILLSRIRN